MYIYIFNLEALSLVKKTFRMVFFLPLVAPSPLVLSFSLCLCLLNEPPPQSLFNLNEPPPPPHPSPTGGKLDVSVALGAKIGLPFFSKPPLPRPDL